MVSFDVSLVHEYPSDRGGISDKGPTKPGYNTERQM